MKKTYRQSWSFVGDCYCSYPDPLCLDERNLLLLLHPSAIMISGLRDDNQICEGFGGQISYKSAAGNNTHSKMHIHTLQESNFRD